MIVIQTTIDQKAMTALARMTRKTVRRGRNGPVRLMAWFVVLLEAYLTVIYVRAGLGGWQMNLLLGGIMLACILGEDWVNGAIGLRRTAPEELEVNAAFQDDRCYVCRSQGGERWWLYSQIWVAGGDRGLFCPASGPETRPDLPQEGLYLGHRGGISGADSKENRAENTGSAVK